MVDQTYPGTTGKSRTVKELTRASRETKYILQIYLTLCMKTISDMSPTHVCIFLDLHIHPTASVHLMVTPNTSVDLMFTSTSTTVNRTFSRTLSTRPLVLQSIEGISNDLIPNKPFAKIELPSLFNNEEFKDQVLVESYAQPASPSTSLTTEYHPERSPAYEPLSPVYRPRRASEEGKVASLRFLNRCVLIGYFNSF